MAASSASAGEPDKDVKLPFAGDIPVMHEEAAAAGIDHVYGGPWEFFVGGGGAAFDCNGDRFPDVFLAGGKGDSALYVNRSQAGGRLAFEKMPIDVDPKDLQNVTGAYPLDIDQDGYKDLVLLRVGSNILLKGGPECQLHQGELPVEIRRRPGLDDGILGGVRARREVPDARLRQLCRPRRARFALGHLFRQRADPPEGGRGRPARTIPSRRR